MNIRKLKREDWSQYFDLRHALWPDHSYEDFEEEAKVKLNSSDKNYMVYVAEEDEKLIGLIEVSIRDTAIGCKTRNIGYIEGWYTLPAFRYK